MVLDLHTCWFLDGILLVRACDICMFLGEYGKHPPRDRWHIIMEGVNAQPESQDKSYIRSNINCISMTRAEISLILIQSPGKHD